MSEASVSVNNKVIARINTGCLVLIGIEKTDTHSTADRLLQRLLNYRVFADPDGKMNLGLSDINGGLLLVPQFTLPADTRKGNRPSFSAAAAPEQGMEIFNYLIEQARLSYHTIATGEFGSNMQVSLTNDGPVTFWLQVD